MDWLRRLFGMSHAVDLPALKAKVSENQRPGGIVYVTDEELDVLISAQNLGDAWALPPDGR